MKHPNAREHLSAYLDGELDERARREVDAALDESPELRADLEALRRTAALVRSMPRRGAPPGFAGRVMAAIGAEGEDATTVPHAAPERFRRWLPAMVAAAACLVVGLVTLLAPPRSREPEHARRFETTKKDPAKLAQATRPASTLGAEKAQDRADRFRASTAAASPKSTRRESEGVGGKGIKGMAIARAGGRAPGKPEPLMPGPGAPPAPKPPGRDMAKRPADPMAGGAAECALADPTLVSVRKNAAAAREEFKGLVARIEREQPAARRRRVGPARTPAPTPEAGRRELLLPYRDLARSLADVQWVLRQARVAHALQPEGSGRFVIEATVDEDLAADLMARLTVAVTRRGRTRDTRLPGQLAEEAPKPKPVVSERHPRRKVHLVVRFRPARAAGAAEKK